MIIHLKNLSVKYGKKIVLDNIDYKILSGKHLLIGPNGSGKTTFAKCLLGLIKYEGKIFDDENKKYSTNLLEVYKIMNLKVKDIINIYSEIFYVRKENITSMIRKFKMERILDNKISNLSTGESKVLGFSIALNLNSNLIVLDEPFEGLDLSRKNLLINVINDIENNMVIITHELDIIEKLKIEGISFLLNGKILGEYNDIKLKNIYFSRNKMGNVIDSFNTGRNEYFITEGTGEYPITSFRTIEEILGVE